MSGEGAATTPFIKYLATRYFIEHLINFVTFLAEFDLRKVKFGDNFVGFRFLFIDSFKDN